MTTSTSNFDTDRPIVDRASAFNLLSEVIGIGSIWGNERELAEHIAKRMREWGLTEVELVDGAVGGPSVVGWLRGTGGGRSLMLNGHIDMYELSADWTRDPWTASEEDGKIFGAGVADMKAGTSACLAAVQHLAASKRLRGDVLVACVAGHFEGGVGTRAVLENGHVTDGAIVTEPSDMRMVVAQRGALYVNITVRGRQAHSSRPDLGINAIDKAADLIRQLRNFSFSPDNEHGLLGRGHTMNVGTVHGGTKHNQIPDRCTITVDFRTLPDVDPRVGFKQVRAFLDDYRQQEPDLDFELSFSRHWLSGPRVPFEVDQSWDVVNTAAASFSELFDRPVEKMGLGGWTDMAVLGAANVRCVNIGPGGGAVNFANEFVPAAEYYAAADLYVKIAEHYCGR